MKLSDLVGKRFERLTVRLRVPQNSKDGRVMWECQCDCGSITYIPTYSLKSGNTRSCGCLRNEQLIGISVTHGMRNSSEYSIWCDIKTRCYNKARQHYHYYGGRGIEMSPEWRDSFEAFYRDMGPRPSPKHSIDRRDNNLGYSKENCRWATRIEQANNTQRNIYIEFLGDKKTLSEWCKELGLHYKTVYRRLKRGMSFEDAIYGDK